METSRKDWRRGAERVVLTRQAPSQADHDRTIESRAAALASGLQPAPDGSSSQTDGSSDGAGLVVRVRRHGTGPWTALARSWGPGGGVEVRVQCCDVMRGTE